MEKSRQEILRCYVNSVIRFANFYNNYEKYFDKNPQKKLEGQKFYVKKIYSVFNEVDQLTEKEKSMFYGILTQIKEESQKEEINKLLTLQFAYAKYYKEKYQAVETVFKLKQIYNKRSQEQEKSL